MSTSFFRRATLIAGGLLLAVPASAQVPTDADPGWSRAAAVTSPAASALAMEVTTDGYLDLRTGEFVSRLAAPAPGAIGSDADAPEQPAVRAAPPALHSVLDDGRAVTAVRGIQSPPSTASAVALDDGRSDGFVASRAAPYGGRLDDGRGDSGPVEIDIADDAPSESKTVVAPELGIDLSPAQPNPMRDRATVWFRVAAGGQATVRVYDVRGREVLVVYDESVQADQEIRARIDARGLASGVYVVVLDAAGQRVSQTIRVIR